jgi:hypothetical protein
MEGLPHQRWTRYVGMGRDVLTDATIFSPIVHKGEVEVTGIDTTER